MKAKLILVVIGLAVVVLQSCTTNRTCSTYAKHEVKQVQKTPV
jgi:outer membrane lipoprotein SlyB